MEKQSKINPNAAGALLAVTGGMCWGLSGTMGQYLFDVQGMDSRWLVPIRLGAAGVILLIYSFIRWGRRTVEPWTTRTSARELVLYGLCGVSFCQFFYFLTIQLSSAAIGTILQDLSPIFILTVACLTAHRKPKAYEIISIVCALSGIFLLTTHGNVHHLAMPASALLAGILCAICVMIYNVVPVHLMQVYPVPLLQGWAFLMGGVFFTLLFRPWTFRYTPTVQGIFGILFVVIVGNVMAFVMYMKGVSLIGPEKSILYGFSEPVTAAILSSALFHNAFTVWDFLGFALVFAMLALISAGGMREKAVRNTI